MVHVGGHARHRGAYAAVGLGCALFWSGYVHAQPSTRSESNESGGTQSVAQIASSSFAENESAPYQPDCEHPRDETEYGACAEANGATASWFEVGGLLLTVIFIAWAASSAATAANAAKKAAEDASESIAAARESADATKLAASAANRHADIAGDTAKRQLRAYLFVEAVEFRRSGNAAYFTIGFKNSGQTPAYKMRVFGHIGIFDWPLPDPFNPIDDAQTDISIESVGPQSSRTKTEELTLTDAEFAEFQNGTKTGVVWGKAIYRDAFRKTRHTHYRWFIGGPVRTRFAGASAPGGNVDSMAAHTQGNDAD